MSNNKKLKFFLFLENHKTIAKSTVKNLTQDEDNNMNTCIGSSDMKLEKDFICTHTIVGRYLVVMFASEESVCEIGIHGGITAFNLMQFKCCFCIQTQKNICKWYCFINSLAKILIL